MKKITSISKENFPAAIKYAYRLNKKMAVNAFAQYVILPIGSILFAFHALILLLGLAQMVAQDNNTTIAIVDALPNTEVYMPRYDPDGSTGGKWREADIYFEMRNLFGMFYQPGGTGMNQDN